MVTIVVVMMMTPSRVSRKKITWNGPNQKEYKENLKFDDLLFQTFPPPIIMTPYPTDSCVDRYILIDLIMKPRPKPQSIRLVIGQH